MIHYDVQLFGGVVLHKGKIAEMATGEGKTLVATLPVFLNALAGKGVHVVTVNDYLAKRDSEWMGPCTSSTVCRWIASTSTSPTPTPAARLTWPISPSVPTTNSASTTCVTTWLSVPKDLVQRKHHYAIVDEVDSVLIDDARTPLIISGPVPKGDDQLFEQYRPQSKASTTSRKNLVTPAGRCPPAASAKERTKRASSLYRSPQGSAQDTNR